MEFEQDSARGEGSMLKKLMKKARRVIGRKDYEEVVQEDGDEMALTEQRMKETPSAVFAHKSIEVS